MGKVIGILGLFGIIVSALAFVVISYEPPSPSGIIVGDLEVMTEDYEDYRKLFSIDNSEMTWYEATEQIEDYLGKEGWRLPTIEELNFLYENGKRVGLNGCYMSSTESSDNKNEVWIKDFKYDSEFAFNKEYPFKVRAVRDK